MRETGRYHLGKRLWCVLYSKIDMLHTVNTSLQSLTFLVAIINYLRIFCAQIKSRQKKIKNKINKVVTW